jgi:hypothetical protein
LNPCIERASSQRIQEHAARPYNRRVREDDRFSDGQYAVGFLEGFHCVFREVDRAKANWREYPGWALWLYEGKKSDARPFAIRKAMSSKSASMPANNAINTDGEHTRAFGVHVFAAGYGKR